MTTRPPAPPAMIELHIEELTLRGFAPQDRYAIAAAIERELSRLFAESGAPPSLLTEGALDRLDAGAFHVPSGARPDLIGSQVAHAVFGGLAPGGPPARQNTPDLPAGATPAPTRAGAEP
jgi:hypothetical protein